MQSKNTQNEALKIFDVAILAMIAAAVMWLFFAFNLGGNIYLEILLLGVFLGEFTIGLWLYFVGCKIKKQLKKEGKWNKLSFKEQIDLHEWKRHD
jgi:ABC-type thiamin/hydroxymethylpyrimidine transport system permease subunit